MALFYLRADTPQLCCEVVDCFWQFHTLLLSKQGKDHFDSLASFWEVPAAHGDDIFGRR